MLASQPLSVNNIPSTAPLTDRATIRKCLFLDALTQKLDESWPLSMKMVRNPQVPVSSFQFILYVSVGKTVTLETSWYWVNKCICQLFCQVCIKWRNMDTPLLGWFASLWLAMMRITWMTGSQRCWCSSASLWPTTSLWFQTTVFVSSSCRELFMTVAIRMNFSLICSQQQFHFLLHGWWPTSRREVASSVLHCAGCSEWRPFLRSAQRALHQYGSLPGGSTIDLQLWLRPPTQFGDVYFLLCNYDETATYCQILNLDSK